MTVYKPAANNRALMATNLSFNRSIAPSPALFTGFNSARSDDTLQPVLLQKVRGRGAFLNSYLDKAGKVSKEFDPSKPNIIEDDVANLPPNCNSFKLDFSLNITAESRRPNTCELPALEDLLQKIGTAYDAKDGYRFLAERYVWRLVNGSMMWRNYTIATNKQVMIAFEHQKQFHTVKAYCRDLSKTKFPGGSTLRDVVADVDVLIAAFAQALATSDGDPLILRITATGVVGYGGEVYPSQVFSDRRTTANVRPPKELVSHPLGDGRRQAKMNATKIGNAIRHIDEFHGNDEAATAIEAYGFVQHNLSALRPVTGANIYNLLWQDSPGYPSLIAKAKNAASIPADIHYFMAMLIRGGVFAASGASDNGG